MAEPGEAVVRVAAGDDGVTTITLDRPDKRNAMSLAMCRQLHDALGEVAASPARVVVLRGAGRDFSVGADIDAEPAPRDGRALLDVVGAAFDSTRRLHEMPQVTIAAIDGACAGGALGWAAACDVRVAATRARFATAFLTVGASGDMGLIWLLTHMLGAARARELLLFPERIDADRALALGLATRLCPADTVHDEARAIARRLAAGPAFALRMMKANFLSAEALPFDRYVEIETARLMAVSEGGGLREGFAAHRAAITARL